MEREIKFRAFIDGRMINSDDLAFETYEPLKDQLAKCENLMQYTGIKLNDIEVYEGDIVFYSVWNTKDGNSPLGNNGWKTGEVYFQNGRYVVKGNEFWDTLNYNNIKVIGNIYENPDLINS